MTIAVEETVESGSASIGESNRATLEYICICDSSSDTEQGCDAAVLLASPSSFRGYPRRSLGGKTVRITPNVIRMVTVEYGVDQQQTPQSQASTGTPGSVFNNATFTFNVVGGTEQIKTAISTTSYRAGSETVVDVKKVIGLDLASGQVRGVNIFAPVCDFSLSTELENARVTPGYIKAVAKLVGKKNDEEFAGFEKGEVLCRAVRLSKKGDERWQGSFEFSFSENKENINVGGIVVANKKGWDYLDVMYKEDTSQTIEGKSIHVPTQVNVHEVYKDADFSEFGIGE